MMVVRTPILCLITDRRRLMAACGQPEQAWRHLLLAQIRGAAAGGADLVQIRELDLKAGDLCDLARDAMEAVRGSSCRIVVSDRVDIALAARCDGVHLRESSAKTGAIRRISADLLVGRSVHSIDGVHAAGAVDYLIAGTVFPTPSKVSRTCLGLQGLGELTRAVRSVPVLAIGGVTVDLIAPIARVGAKGMAGIGAFIPAVDGEEISRAVEKLTKKLRKAFDTVGLVF